MTRAPLLSLLAAMALASPALADTIGPGEMPPWPIDCGPIEPLRITEGALPIVPAAVLFEQPVAMIATAPVASFGPHRPEPVPAPVTIAAVGWLSAIVIGALMLRGKSA